MTQQARHLEVPGAIDPHLSIDKFHTVSRTALDEYQTWCAARLSKRHANPAKEALWGRVR